MGGRTDCNNKHKTSNWPLKPGERPSYPQREVCHPLLERKTTTEMLHQHQPSFSSIQLGQHCQKWGKQQTRSHSTEKKSCHEPPLPPLSPPKNTETIKAKPGTREVKCWVWAHQATSTLCLLSVSHQRSVVLLQSCWHKVLPERGAAKVSRQTKIKKNKLYDTAHCLQTRARFSEGGVNR